MPKTFAPCFAATASIALLIGWSSCATTKTQSSCQQVRAAFDVGSGSTKLKVARVDTCLQKVVAFLDLPPAFESRSVAYKDDLSRNNRGEFSAEVMDQGVEAMKQLKAAAEELGATEFAGAATAAFRAAKNASQLVARFEKEAGVRVRIITQKDEALLGFIAAAASADVPRHRVVVWDIGGGSMQITTQNEENQFFIYEGIVASVPFKDLVIQKVKGQDPRKVKSPNPLTAKDISRAARIAVSLARTEVIPSEILSKLRDASTEVIGIGGVHFASVRAQTGTGDAPYTLKHVLDAASARPGVTDAAIGGKFSDTEITNVILVSGFMTALGIEKVRPANVTMSDGVLLNPIFWANSTPR